jgi:hypothetical protein
MRNGPFHVAVIFELSVGKSTNTSSPGFSDILTSQPGRTDIIKHEIKTTSETPISLKPYRIPYARRDEVKKLLDQMLKDDGVRIAKIP